MTRVMVVHWQAGKMMTCQTLLQQLSVLMRSYSHLWSVVDLVVAEVQEEAELVILKAVLTAVAVAEVVGLKRGLNLAAEEVVEREVPGCLMEEEVEVVRKMGSLSAVGVEEVPGALDLLKVAEVAPVSLGKD